MSTRLPSDNADQSSAVPQRFLVLNIDAAESALKFEAPSKPAAHHTEAALPAASRRVTGHIVVDPEDLTRISGVMRAGGLVVRLRQGVTAEPKTLAALTAPNSRVHLRVDGDVAYWRSLPGPMSPTRGSLTGRLRSAPTGSTSCLAHLQNGR